MWQIASEIRVTGIDMVANQAGKTTGNFPRGSIGNYCMAAISLPQYTCVACVWHLLFNSLTQRGRKWSLIFFSVLAVWHAVRWNKRSDSTGREPCFLLGGGGADVSIDVKFGAKMYFVTHFQESDVFIRLCVPHCSARIIVNSSLSPFIWLPWPSQYDIQEKQTKLSLLCMCIGYLFLAKLIWE